MLGALGVDYVTLHAAGGPAMLEAGVDGLRRGAEAAGLPAPVALAVTVLTSDGGAPANMLAHRVAVAVEARCDGIVCSPLDVREAKLYAPRLVAVVPGIRLPGTPTHDQARSATPGEAIANGADVLVVGRTVTGADNPSAQPPPSPTPLRHCLTALARGVFPRSRQMPHTVGLPNQLPEP